MPIKLDFDGGQPGAAPIIKPAIIKLLKNYRKDIKEGDTLSGWVSAEEVMALIAHNHADGIRIYFGRHAADDNSDPNKLSVILVATKSSDGGKATWQNSVDQLNEFSSDGPVNSVSFNFHDPDYTGMGDDAIPLCPQNCPNSETL